jgi:hypothetical protein
MPACRDTICPFLNTNSAGMPWMPYSDARRGGRVDVDFDEPDGWLELLGSLLEDRSHGTAGAAPRRPEIDYDGNVIAGDLALEPIATELDWLSRKETGATAAAFGLLGRL